LVSLQPLLNAMAVGQPGVGQPATAEQLVQARADVEELIGLHGRLNLRRLGDDKATTAVQDATLDEVDEFLRAVEAALDRMCDLPPQDSSIYREIWRLTDQIQRARTPASRPTDKGEALVYRRDVEEIAGTAVTLAKERLARIEELAVDSTQGSLTLEPQSVDAAQLGTFIKQTRKASKVSAQVFKERIGKTDGYIRMLERGAKVASAETYERIFFVLGLRVARDGSTLTVRDDDGRQVEIHLVPSTPKSVLVQQFREVSHGASAVTQPETALTQTGQPALSLADFKEDAHRPELQLLGKVTRLLAAADTATLQAVLRLMHSRIVLAEAQQDLDRMEMRDLDAVWDDVDQDAQPDDR